LEKVFNGFTVVSSNGSLNCSELDHYYSTQLIRGAYNCAGPSVTPAIPPSNATNTTLPAPAQAKASKLSTGAKAGIGIGVGVAFLAAASALGNFLFLKKFRIQKRSKREERTGTNADDKKPELPQGGYHEKTELEVNENPGELQGNSVSGLESSGELRVMIPRKPVPQVQMGESPNVAERHELL
jgi:hypothetical protein